jgi:hypothetical protein
MGFFEGFRRGRDAARAELGIVSGMPNNPWVDPSPAVEPVEAEDGAPAAEGEQWPRRVAELEAEVATLKAERAHLGAHIAELEVRAAMPSPAEVFAEVLRLPGFKQLARNKYHPDKHGKDQGDDAKWQFWNEATQKINAAYDIIEHGS